MKALVGAFNQEKALVGAFSVIVQPVVESMENYTALFQVVQKLEELPTDDIPLITTTSPEELSRQQELELQELATSLGEEDIVDVISNFIADKDPMLQVATTINYQASHSAEIALHFQSTFKSSLKYQYFIF